MEGLNFIGAGLVVIGVGIGIGQIGGIAITDRLSISNIDLS